MPYAPTVQDHSGLILAQGFQQGLQGLLEGKAKGDELRKQRKRTETILGALMPEQKDALAEKSLGELEGLLDAMALERVQQSQQAEARRADERLELERAEGGRADERLQIDRQEANRRAVAAEREQAMFAGEQAALRAAVAPPPDPTMLEQLAAMDAPGRGVLQPGARPQPRAAAPSPARRYLEAGGADPRLLDQLIALEAGGAGAQFVPELVDLGGGAKAVTTSRKSAVPYVPPNERSRGREPDPVGEAAKLRRQYDLLFNEPAEMGTSAAQYVQRTRDAEGKLKPGAKTNPRMEKRLKELEALDARIGELQANGSPTAQTAPARAGEAPMPAPMSRDEFRTRMFGAP